MEVVFLLALYLKHVNLVEGLVWYVSYYIFGRVFSHVDYFPDIRSVVSYEYRYSFRRVYWVLNLLVIGAVEVEKLRRYICASKTYFVYLFLHVKFVWYIAVSCWLFQYSYITVIGGGGTSSMLFNLVGVVIPKCLHYAKCMVWINQCVWTVNY